MQSDEVLCLCCCRPRSEHSHKLQCPETTYFIANALVSTPSAIVAEREKVARIIDPEGWAYFDAVVDKLGHGPAGGKPERALTKADAILSLLSSTPAGGEDASPMIEPPAPDAEARPPQRRG